MDKFLETYNISKLNQEEAEILKRPITAKLKQKIKKKKILTHKSPGWDSFTDKFDQTLGKG